MRKPKVNKFQAVNYVMGVLKNPKFKINDGYCYSLYSFFNEDGSTGLNLRWHKGDEHPAIPNESFYKNVDFIKDLYKTKEELFDEFREKTFKEIERKSRESDVFKTTII